MRCEARGGRGGGGGISRFVGVSLSNLAKYKSYTITSVKGGNISRFLGVNLANLAKDKSYTVT